MATKFLQVLLSKRAPIINQMCTRITPWKHLHRNIMHTNTRCVQIGGYHTSAMVQSDRDKPLDEIISSRDPRWMRENCRCDSCYNHSTAQRNVIFYELKPEQLDIADIQRDDTMQSISIRWADGHQSVYNEEWLINNSYPGNRGRIIRKFWDGATMKSNEIDQVPREVFIDDSNEGVNRLLNSLLVYGVGIVKDVEATVEATKLITDRLCFIQETLYGRMWSFTSDMSRGDTAFTNLALGAHTDTTYLSIPVGIQVFHCTYHDGEGGETLLVDGFNAADGLRKDGEQKAFDILCKYRIHHENKDRDVHHVQSLDPVLKVNPLSGDLEMIRYNHYDRSPISSVPNADLPGYYDALAALSARVTDPRAEYWIKLNPGIVLFIDNWRVMHGRSAFTGLRHVCGCYLPRDDWLGKARVLGMIP